MAVSSFSLLLNYSVLRRIQMKINKVPSSLRLPYKQQHLDRAWNYFIVLTFLRRGFYDRTAVLPWARPNQRTYFILPSPNCSTKSFFQTKILLEKDMMKQTGYRKTSFELLVRRHSSSSRFPRKAVVVWENDN